MAETTVQPNRRGQYLVLYNVVSCFLWFAVLARTSLLLVLQGHEHVYNEVGAFTKWTQTLAVVEILHSATGLVRASLFTTFLQVLSRVFIVWAVVDRWPATTTASPFYSSMLVAWSLAEVVRYAYLAQHLRGAVPAPLVWVRYNAFFVLYPMGISSECVMVYRAITVAPQPLERAVWFAALVAYVPGAYVLMGHMMRQRRRIIKGKGKAAPAPTRRERVSSVQ